ncbi:cytochrome-c oxidase, cbb3-type subunit II [Leucothrix mucor]|uniref:cytochrome-c oxidase, cbb3-type subunit II n=1 Tax=Leucothrix mucor TaxID=45248 RepID=UPI0003B3F93D|nr:cytochrome-c oxidase, cbb3-type subunit II [Leucothrix mucor]
MKHDFIERNVGVMGVLIALVISVAGLAEIVPLMYQAQTTKPAPGVVPYPPVELAGRDVYVSEGCYNCHSQMIRPFVSESLRYGPASVAGESVYDRPFQWGSKRTGPDLARVGGRYTDEWHRMHLMNPRDLVPESNMPGFPWLAERTVDPELITTKMNVLTMLGHPYTQEQIDGAAEKVKGVTEMDALIAYLQFLGVANNGRAKQ